MRILFAQHDRWERSIGGSEFYEHHLQRELAARHEIRTFCTNPSKEFRAGDGPVDGAVVEVPPNRDLFPGSTAERTVSRTFERMIEEYAPEVVHLHDIYLLSPAIPGIAARRGIPVVHTLHEYFLICPRLILRTSANRLCAGPSTRGCLRCGRDMARERYRLKLEGQPALGRWKRRLEIMARRRLTEAYFALARRRQFAALVRDIDLLLCPSHLPA